MSVLWWALLAVSLGGFNLAAWRAYDSNVLAIPEAAAAAVCVVASPFLAVHVYDAHWRGELMPAFWMGAIVGLVCTVPMLVYIGARARDGVSDGLGWIVPVIGAIAQVGFFGWFLTELVDSVNRTVAPFGLTAGGVLLLMVLCGGAMWLKANER